MNTKTKILAAFALTIISSSAIASDAWKNNPKYEQGRVMTFRMKRPEPVVLAESIEKVKSVKILQDHDSNYHPNSIADEGRQDIRVEREWVW